MQPVPPRPAGQRPTPVQVRRRHEGLAAPPCLLCGAPPYTRHRRGLEKNRLWRPGGGLACCIRPNWMALHARRCGRKQQRPCQDAQHQSPNTFPPSPAHRSLASLPAASKGCCPPCLGSSWPLVRGMWRRSPRSSSTRPSCRACCSCWAPSSSCEWHRRGEHGWGKGGRRAGTHPAIWGMRRRAACAKRFRPLARMLQAAPLCAGGPALQTMNHMHLADRVHENMHPHLPLQVPAALLTRPSNPHGASV